MQVLDRLADEKAAIRMHFVRARIGREPANVSQRKQRPRRPGLEHRRTGDVDAHQQPVAGDVVELLFIGVPFRIRSSVG